jgi:type I restriction enzyme M protein
LLETCDLVAIISLPKFAFAPYTKEKTYALFFVKRSGAVTRTQTKPIWMYIIDNDGLANSDKRFPTKLRNNRNGWLHDEISGWVSTEGDEMPGLLEERWGTFEDRPTGTSWLNEQGKQVTMRKAELVPMAKILSDKYITLLPEYYLRGYRPQNGVAAYEYKNYQARDVAASTLFSVISGNSGLTEEYLYSLLLHDGDRKYSLLTGSIDVENAPHVYQCPHPRNSDKLITTYSGEGIHVVRKGKAGYISYLSSGDYTLNDDAYIVVDKGTHGCVLSLKWVALACRHIFCEYSSSSDNGTWNMAGFLEHARFDIPSWDEQQSIIRELGQANGREIVSA